MRTETMNAKELVGVSPGRLPSYGWRRLSRAQYDSGRRGRGATVSLDARLYGPRRISADHAPAWCGEHPHRGFETVTIMYHGKWRIVTRRGAAVLSGPAMCSG